MAIDNYIELLKSGSYFQKIHFLDNFYAKVNVQSESETDLVDILKIALADNDQYIKRTGLGLLCDLTISSLIQNRYVALTELHNALSGNSVELQIVALKYFPNFHEAHTAQIVSKLRELTDSDNGDVSGQAYFCLGLLKLTEATVNTGIQTSIVLLIDAEKLFQASDEVVENRDDAKFYLKVIRWARTSLSNEMQTVAPLFKEVETSFHRRSLFEYSEQALELDYLIFKMFRMLHDSKVQAMQSRSWLEVSLEVRALADTYVGAHTFANITSVQKPIAQQIFNSVLSQIQNHIYSTNLVGEGSRLQRLRESEGVSTFGEFINHLLQQVLVNENGSKENMPLFALLVENLGQSQGVQEYNKIKDRHVAPDLLASIHDMLKTSAQNALSTATGSLIGNEILASIVADLKQKLPNYPSTKFTEFIKVLAEVIRYARSTQINSSKSEFHFLYAESEGGLGQKAIEENLQDDMLDFFRHSNLADGLGHERAKFVDGGRVDIVYQKDAITIPIELKKTLNQWTVDDLEKNYISQAQTYTSGYDQLGIFVLMELSEKGTAPSANFKDWFNVHHLKPSTATTVRYPDYIVSVVVPGNKITPSQKSFYK